jgi:hypothetical protein
MTGSAKITDYKKPKVGDTMLFLCVGSTLNTGFALPYIMNGSVDPTGKKDWHVFSDNGFNTETAIGDNDGECVYQSVQFNYLNNEWAFEFK